jgi:hypothetical protein
VRGVNTGDDFRGGLRDGITAETEKNEAHNLLMCDDLLVRNEHTSATGVHPRGDPRRVAPESDTDSKTRL